MSNNLRQHRRGESLYAWLVWGLGAAFFLFEYVTRVAPSVMAPELMRTFHIYALGIGTLSALFYYAYIGMQLPVGMLVDRFGPHKLLTVMALFCAAGSLLFATAHNIYQADIGRFMIGFGAAFAFVGCLKLATSWFSPMRFPLLAGLTQALGMVGASLGEGPMSVLVSHTSWRTAMYISAAIFLALSILIGLIVRDKPLSVTQTATSLNKKQVHNMLKGLITVCKNPKTWTLGGYAGFIYASSAGFGELWGVSYLKHAFHLGAHQAAVAIGFIFIGWAVGAPIMGWLAGRYNRRLLMMGSAACGFVIFLILIIAHHLSGVTITTLMFIYGLTNTGLIIAYALAGHINGHRLAGTSIAFSNMASVIVGSLLQPILGWVIDLSWSGKMLNGAPVYSGHDFRIAVSVFPVCFFLAFCFAFFSKKTTRTSLTNKITAAH